MIGRGASLSMNKHFIDAGANIGQTFDWLHRNPRFDGWNVWCIEPSPRFHGDLMSRACDEVERYNVVVCTFGLGAISGFAPFFSKTDPLGDSFEEHSWTDHDQSNLDAPFVLCPGVVGICDFLARLPKSDEVVLKLDVEGAEYDILFGLLSAKEIGRVTEILVEFHNVSHPVAMDSEQLVRAFDARGIAIDMWRSKE